MKQIALVTGCYGFIGSHLTRKLLSNGWIVYGVDVDVYSPLSTEFLAHDGFSYYHDDIVTLDSLPDCDFVINLAAETHVGNSIENSQAFIETNINGVRNLLDLIRKKPDNVVRKPSFLHFSTDEVYGDRNDTGTPATEDDNLNPSNPYAASKAAADLLIKSYRRTYGIDYCIVRPTNNYGTHQHPEKLIPLTIKLLNWGKKVRLHNEGKPIRTWLNVNDTVDAVLLLIEMNATGVFNLGGKDRQSNYETVQLMLESLGVWNQDSETEFLDLTYKRQGQDMDYLISSQKIFDFYGWKPERTFRKEIARIVSWYVNNPDWLFYKD